ncbi:MAG TPA: acyl-CoA dehydrogenase [Polyangiaceae bacterium]|nr:acyl-CoA dehydrogenase [Polyangiaceae bacterium]
MKLTFDEQQEELARTARAFVTSSTPIARVRALRDSRDAIGFSREIWQQMADLGWTGLCLPEQYSGLGLGFVELCIVLEEAGRRLVPEPLISTLLLGAQALLLGGTPAQKARFLPRVAAGTAVLGLAFQERGSRYELDRIETVAERTPQGFRLRGEKTNVLDGHVADAWVVSARTEQGLALFLVDSSTPGVEIVRQQRIDSRNAANIRLAGVELTSDALLGRPGQGLELLGRVVDRAAIGLSAEMLGSASQTFEDTLAYLKTRKQFDVTLGSFQALQHRAARLFIELSLARAAVLAAARAVDEAPEQVARMASLAKARASDLFVHVANEAVQMHGGIGVTDECQLGFYLKRARVAELTFGDAAWHRRRWAELAGY